MPSDAQVDVPPPDLSEFISRFVPLYHEGNESVGNCPFCDADAHSLKVGAAWRCFNCCSQEVNGADNVGFYACWTDSSREEAIAKLGNGAGLPGATPIEQRPLRKLPFWGWRELDKQPDKAVWIHELSGAVIVWRELVPGRVHLGLITGRTFEHLELVAPPRRCVLVPEDNLASRVRMQRLAAALYRAGHTQVMCLDLGTDSRFGTRTLPEPGEDVLKWAKARSKAYPKPGEDSAQDAPEPPLVASEPPATEPLSQPASAEPPPIAVVVPAPPAAAPKTWDGLTLILGEKGAIKACEHNAKELMAAAKQYDCLHFDSFLYRVRIGTRDWSDADDRDAVCWLQSAHQVAGFTLNQTRTAAMALAHARPHDSLFEFVMGLPEWDGTPRIERAFAQAWGAPDDILTRAASRNFFTALHARAVKPGAQVDNLWAIEGPQGRLKSASLRALGEHFHAEISSPVGTNDFLRELQGVWIAELSELDSLRGREVSTVKRLLSAPSDRFVQKYEKHASAYPRRAVAVATTNEATYWQDSTGARRLIPVRVGEIRLDVIQAERLQWFAEARHLHQAGAHWWEFPEGVSAAQESRQAVDPWEDTLRGYINNGRMDSDGYAKPWPDGWIASAEIMSEWLKLHSSQLGKASSTRLGHVMRRLGFRPRRGSAGTERGWAPKRFEGSEPGE